MKRYLLTVLQADVTNSSVMEVLLDGVLTDATVVTIDPNDYATSTDESLGKILRRVLGAATKDESI